jgi:hypothetical protein
VFRRTTVVIRRCVCNKASCIVRRPRIITRPEHFAYLTCGSSTIQDRFDGHWSSEYAVRSLMKLNATVTSRFPAGTAWFTAKRYRVIPVQVLPRGPAVLARSSCSYQDTPVATHQCARFVRTLLVESVWGFRATLRRTVAECSWVSSACPVITSAQHSHLFTVHNHRTILYSTLHNLTVCFSVVKQISAERTLKGARSSGRTHLFNCCFIKVSLAPDPSQFNTCKLISNLESVCSPAQRTRVSFLRPALLCRFRLKHK